MLSQLLKHANLLQLLFVAFDEGVSKGWDLGALELRVFSEKHAQLEGDLEQLLLFWVVMG